jgi:hypothetical protein
MSEEVKAKVDQIVTLKGPGTTGHPTFVEPARPTANLEELLEHLFCRNGALETPPSPAPKQAHISSGLKGR